ncbi:MAG TPA: HAD-IA family hydrolase [Methylococcus sp.]|nr:HAD-IA family hydrolase [Methylococcus sp.]
MRERFDLVIFDWDGTLYDSIGWIVECLQRAAVDCGLAVPSRRSAHAVIGLGLREAFAALFPGVPGTRLEFLVNAYRSHYFARPGGPSDLFPGVHDLLETLCDAGFQLAIATGKSRNGLDHALAATGLSHLFAATRCADESASKPDPRMLWELLAELRIAPERALMVGDSIHDLEMARNAGVDAIAVACGASEAEDLLLWQPIACLPRTADLLDWVCRVTSE